MKKSIRIAVLICLLAAAMGLLCSCKVNPSEDQLFRKLLTHFRERGHSVSVQKMENGMRAVPIYNASVWYSMLVDGEEVLVYFDESNRADYLAEGIDPAPYSCVTRFGLRFVLVYEGENADVLNTLHAIPGDEDL